MSTSQLEDAQKFPDYLLILEPTGAIYLYDQFHTPTV
eukprot:COSAG01_NODE_37839_length_498_cov_0.807018_1_plen_36_part_10